MSAAWLVPVVAASLLGSVHCAGMCGGFVGFYAGSGARTRTPLALHAAYNLGRLVTYASLGALSGSAGAAVDWAGSSAGFGRAAALLTGFLMIAWGLFALLSALGIELPRFRLPPAILERSARTIARVREYPPLARATLLGLSTTALPCGWLYAFVLSAAGTGSAGRGALVMLAFWSGTVPMLLGLGFLIQRTTRALRAHLPLISAAALVIIGLSNLLSRANGPELATQSIRAAFDLAADHAPNPAEVNLPPCHRHARTK